MTDDTPDVPDEDVEPLEIEHDEQPADGDDEPADDVTGEYVEPEDGAQDDEADPDAADEAGEQERDWDMNGPADETEENL